MRAFAAARRADPAYRFTDDLLPPGNALRARYAAIDHTIQKVQRVPEPRLASLLESGAMVIDTRQIGDFAEGHVPGTINIPLDRSFTTWAGWLIPYDRDYYLIVDNRGGSQPRSVQVTIRGEVAGAAREGALRTSPGT